MLMDLQISWKFNNWDLQTSIIWHQYIIYDLSFSSLSRELHIITFYIFFVSPLCLECMDHDQSFKFTVTRSNT